MSTKPLRIAVLISGNGSNLQALLDDTAHDTQLDIALVLSNKADAFGLKRAEKSAIPTHIISHKDYDNRQSFDQAMHALLVERDIDLVCLAGFMRLLTARFVGQWDKRMLNIHPSLLPAYKGLDTHARVLADGQTVTGCTVHYVVPEMDAGPILLQEKVDVLPDDTPESLQQRVHIAEHRIYPKALRMAANELRKRA